MASTPATSRFPRSSCSSTTTGRAGGVRGRDVLRPLLTVEPPPGTLRLRLVMARRSTRQNKPHVRRRQRSRSAVPPRRPAHAIATLGSMSPGRFWWPWEAARPSTSTSPETVGSARHPGQTARGVRRRHPAAARCEEVNHDGLLTVDRARLWDLPDPRPRILGPAVTLASASRVASWSEGLVTVNQPLDRLRQMAEAYRGAGGTGPLALQVHLSWGPNRDRSRANRPPTVAQQCLR